MGEATEPIPEIESPCIGTCTIGPEGLCIGCFRSADEVGAWLSYSPEQRKEIMQALPARAGLLFED